MPHLRAAASSSSLPVLPAPRVAGPRLRIGLVGGPTRGAQQLERTAAALGYQLEHHTGETAGRGAPSLESLVRRVDVLLILTDLNSHNGVIACRRLATAHGRPHVLLRRCGPARLAEILTDLSAGLVPALAPERPAARGAAIAARAASNGGSRPSAT